MGERALRCDSRAGEREICLPCCLAASCWFFRLFRLTHSPIFCACACADASSSSASSSCTGRVVVVVAINGDCVRCILRWICRCFCCFLRFFLLLLFYFPFSCFVFILRIWKIRFYTAFWFCFTRRKLWMFFLYVHKKKNCKVKTKKKYAQL